MPDETLLKLYSKLKIELPSSQPHGTEQDIAANLTPMKAYKWTLEGDRLIGHTEAGDFVNFIGTGYKLMGMDKNGLPMLEKIVINKVR